MVTRKKYDIKIKDKKNKLRFQLYFSVLLKGIVSF